MTVSRMRFEKPPYGRPSATVDASQGPAAQDRAAEGRRSSVPEMAVSISHPWW